MGNAVSINVTTRWRARGEKSNFRDCLILVSTLASPVSSLSLLHPVEGVASHCALQPRRHKARCPYPLPQEEGLSAETHLATEKQSSGSERLGWVPRHRGDAEWLLLDNLGQRKTQTSKGSGLLLRARFAPNLRHHPTCKPATLSKGPACMARASMHGRGAARFTAQHTPSDCWTSTMSSAPWGCPDRSKLSGSFCGICSAHPWPTPHTADEVALGAPGPGSMDPDAAACHLAAWLPCSAWAGGGTEVRARSKLQAIKSSFVISVYNSMYLSH